MLTVLFTVQYVTKRTKKKKKKLYCHCNKCNDILFGVFL